MTVINRANVKISEHALEKYSIEIRKKKKILPDNPEREIRQLFEQSVAEKMNAGLVLRVMANDFEETNFFKKGKWRFVVCNNIMVTVELDKFSDTSLGYIKKKNLNKR